MKLCDTVDVYGGYAVKPGGTAKFKIWLSSSGAESSGATVTLSTSLAAAAPRFTDCPRGTTTKCDVGKIGNGQSVELHAAVVVPNSSANGKHVNLIARLSTTKPKAATEDSARVTAKVAAVSRHRSAGSVPGRPAGSSGRIGPTTAVPAPAIGTEGLSRTSLPLAFAGTATSPTGGNVGSLLPSIPPVTPSPVAQRGTRTPSREQVASVGPLNGRLAGTQLIALAALCAAIVIVIARFTLRTRPSAANGAAAGAAAAGAAAAGGTAGEHGRSGEDTGVKKARSGKANAGRADLAAAAAGAAGAAGATVTADATGSNDSPATTRVSAAHGPATANGPAGTDSAAATREGAANDRPMADDSPPAGAPAASSCPPADVAADQADVPAARPGSSPPRRSPG